MELGNTVEDFTAFFKSYFQTHQWELDAVLCNNDECAAIVIRLLQEHGMQVPEDVAVVGFNNSNLALLTRPLMASVDRRVDELGDKAITMLFDRMDDHNLPLRTEKVDMKFVWRNSAGHEGASVEK